MPFGSDDPVAQGFVDSGTQRLVAARDGHDFGTEQFHAADVRRLPLHVDRTHVDGARHAETRACGGGSHAVLAGAGLRDDALRAEALGQQALPDRVVDLVRAGVREVFTLQPHLRAPAPRQRRRVGKRRGPANPGAQLHVELGLEGGIRQDVADALFEAIERRHECLGHVAPAERAEAAARVRKLAAERLRQQRFAVDLEGLGLHCCNYSQRR